MSFGASPGASTLHPVAPLHAEQLWGAIVIAIMLVESTSLLRGALAAVLSTEADLDVVAELGRIDKAVPVARAVHPDVVVVGADLLDDDGISTLEELHRDVPTCAVIVLVDTGAPGAVQAEREPYVRGFIGRDTAPNQLADYIRRAAKGERIIDPTLAVAAWCAPRSPFTARELEILRVAALGLPSNEIASRLHLSVGTVRNYVSAIMRKTGARNRLEAIRIAQDAGWL
jgi:two-component system, NarL family, response regulator DesR